MTVIIVRGRAVIARIAGSFSLPRSAAAAKEYAQKRNAEARQERERQEGERRARLREISEQTDRAAGRSRARARVDAAAIYAERNTPRAQDESRSAPPATPRRPRSFGELARGYYVPVEGTGLLPTGQRGGAR